MTIKDLAVEHDYYASMSNYSDNKAGGEFETWPDFIDEFGDAQIHYNLCIRWDVKYIDEDGFGPDWKPNESLGFKMEIVIIAQRKGIYMPFQINRVFDKDAESIVAYLKPHAEYIKKMWNPIIL